MCPTHLNYTHTPHTHTLTPLDPLVSNPVLFRNTFHPINLYLNIVSAWKSIWNTVDYLLVNLGAVDCQTRGRVQLLVANVALEVLGFLMVYENLLIIKLPIAVPGEVSRLVPIRAHHNECTTNYREPSHRTISQPAHGLFLLHHHFQTMITEQPTKTPPLNMSS